MKTSRARILLVRDSFPYLGGSSTYLYLLFEVLQKRFPQMECWNILTPTIWKMGKRHYGTNWTNPKGFANIRTFVLDERKGMLKIRRALKEKPVSVVISKSRKTTALLKQLDPGVPVWHLTSTCSVIKSGVASGRISSMESAIRHLRSNGIMKLRSPEELQAVRAADRILCHTNSMKMWYYTFYPQFRDKVEDEIFWDYPLLEKQFKHIATKTPWKKRPIDLLFVASDWSRPEKNFSLMKKLCQAFSEKKIMVVGFLPKSLPSTVITFDAMSQEEVVEAMGQAKVVVCPSRYDEGPNVLFEGALAGSNIVCSRNCGNYQLSPKELVAQLDLPDFARKIKRALKSQRKPNTDYFSKTELGGWICKHFSKKSAELPEAEARVSVKSQKRSPQHR